jgi:hypothetical protein
VRRRVPDVPSLAAHPLLPCSPARSCRPAVQPSEARLCPDTLTLTLTLTVSLSHAHHTARDIRQRPGPATALGPLGLPLLDHSACLPTPTSTTLFPLPLVLTIPPPSPIYGLQLLPQHRLASASQPRLANLSGIVRSTQPAHTCPLPTAHCPPAAMLSIVFLFPISHDFPCSLHGHGHGHGVV